MQHASESVLRHESPGSAKSHRELIERIRLRVPDITLRTTHSWLSGETEADFEELCEFLEEVEFDYVGVFPYSREEGTRAAIFRSS